MSFLTDLFLPVVVAIGLSPALHKRFHNPTGGGIPADAILLETGTDTVLLEDGTTYLALES